MYSHVSVQGGGSVECFAADITFMRFVICMDDFVPAQRTSLSET